ncbi:hypothetical protein AVEN_224800-1 [Araneus ventricosus]|uniref:RNase H type-1 domain-containing protein n=1 Tax=Araneus ventricosus TaxID=182803 RepID=A0A4Y2FYM2_ARAVE|nr:hypothetical protein AVEN_224800-1 [Araneus ventricosus]
MNLRIGMRSKIHFFSKLYGKLLDLIRFDGLKPLLGPRCNFGPWFWDEQIPLQTNTSHYCYITVIYKAGLPSIEALKSAGSRSAFFNSVKDKLSRAGGLVGLSWVKAHVGITGNELADRLAKEASVDGQEIDIPNSLSLLKYNLKKQMLTDWQLLDDQYQSDSGARVRRFIPYSKSKTFYLY